MTLVLQSGKGGKYLLDLDFANLEYHEIICELTATYTFNQNGKSELFSRIKVVRSMHHHHSVPKCFWNETL